jgi:hypothetical protein
LRFQTTTTTEETTMKTTDFEITTPRLAKGADPVELTYSLMVGLYGEIGNACCFSVRRGGLKAYVAEHVEQLARWLDSEECVINREVRSLAAAAVTAGQAFVAASR